MRRKQPQKPLGGYVIGGGFKGTLHNLKVDIRRNTPLYLLLIIILYRVALWPHVWTGHGIREICTGKRNPG